jgi:hypothetical protein
MNRWPAIRDDFSRWLRAFPLVANVGRPSETREVIKAGDAPVYLDSAFWSQRTHEAEARARQHLTDTEIGRIFDEVAAVIDDDLRRFDPLIAYFARYFPDGDPGRIEDERQAAHSVKRDLAWAAVERSIGEVGFFSGLLPWYERGRWPCGWVGEYPGGHVLVL